VMVFGVSRSNGRCKEAESSQAVLVVRQRMGI
jgi:hypothetical protein